VPSGRPRTLARRHRSRSDPDKAFRRIAWRPHLSGEHARQGQHILVHIARPSAGEGRDVSDLILIVEDNDKNMKLARDLLRYHGFTTIEATNAEDGIALARERVPALILMDIQLPGMDGVTALAQLRADPTTAGVPVVAMTAS